MMRISLSDIKITTGDDLRLEYEGAPFTGEVVEDPEGLLLSRHFYVNGILHGSSKQWWPDGTLRSEGENYNGRPRGRLRKWHQNGRLAEESEFSDSGELISRQLWDESGNRIEPRRRAARNA